MAKIFRTSDLLPISSGGINNIKIEKALITGAFFSFTGNNQVMNEALIQKLIFWSGIGHFALCLGSLLIPKVLQWQKHLKNLQPLLRQMFWTYAAYILVINCCFGILSVFASYELLNHSFLAKSITLFIGIYWLTRIGIQFFYFDRSEAPKGLLYTVGEIALIGLFVIFALTYLIAFFFNNGWI